MDKLFDARRKFNRRGRAGKQLRNQCRKAMCFGRFIGELTYISQVPAERSPRCVIESHRVNSAYQDSVRLSGQNCEVM